MKFKIRQPKKTRPTPRPVVSERGGPVLKSTGRLYRVQSQRVDTRYAHIWYDLEQNGEIFETPSLAGAFTVKAAMESASRVLRLRVVAIMEVSE